MVVKLVEVANIEVDLNFCDEEDLTIALLDSTSITFCYDTAAKVTDVTSIMVRTLGTIILPLTMQQFGFIWENVWFNIFNVWFITAFYCFNFFVLPIAC